MAAKLKQVKVYVHDYEYVIGRAKYGETFAEAFSKAIRTSKRSHSPVKQDMTTKGGEM